MDFVEYQCEEGYNFTGANVIQCEATGNWSTPQPCQCKQLQYSGEQQPEHILMGTELFG